jgi:hypothetical protein
MANTIGATPPPQAAAPPAAPRKPEAPPPAPAPTLSKDVVQLSKAAQSALQEAAETPAQTAREAASGDQQARRLQARQSPAPAAAEQPPIHVVV